MNTITILSLTVGAVAGALLVLWADGRYWGKRLQTAVSQREHLAAQLRKLEKQMGRQQQQIQQQGREIGIKTRRVEQLMTECMQVSGELQTAVADLKVTRENLLRVNDYADELQKTNDEWMDKYRSAEEALAIERAQLKEVMGELTAVQTENGHMRQTVLTVASKMKAFGELQEKARHQEDQITRLREEKLAATTALRHAESQVRSGVEAAQQQRQTLDVLRQQHKEQGEALTAVRKQSDEQQEKLLGLRQQVQDGEEVKRRLTAVNQELAAAKAEVETLQGQLRDHTHMQQAILQDNGSLTLINGIGPRYAQRLKDSGITSLTQLANASANDVRTALNMQEWQGRNIQSWIDEAKDLVASFVQKI
ncbi:MAG: hypothetical protein KDE56_12655 [Anaerolineales bacterium]|nr:hypothetical protein [Anaerolineales bacterium]